MDWLGFLSSPRLSPMHAACHSHALSLLCARWGSCVGVAALRSSVCVQNLWSHLEQVPHLPGSHRESRAHLLGR
jgi:hypothetical protein